jgi:hypothetical protein
MRRKKSIWYEVTLIALWGVGFAMTNSDDVYAQPVSLKAAIESLRKTIPEAKTISEMNGFSLADINGQQFTLTRLTTAANTLAIRSFKDPQLLLEYLDDKDPKIRYIAATVLNTKYGVYPNGMSLSDIIDIASPRHKQMIEQFRKKIMTSKADMPDCLKNLMKATSFDDDQKGESPDFTPNYKAYLEASNMIYALELSDLDYVLERGSPAGRIYAAVLIKQSGRAGDNLSFDKLLKDNATVSYQSGCKVMSTTVAEVAKSFIEKGKFFNFSFGIFCKMTMAAPSASQGEQTISSGVQTISSGEHAIPAGKQVKSEDNGLNMLLLATTVEHYQQGDSNRPAPAWLSFQALLKQGAAAKPAIEKLLASKGSGARIYGAILMWQIDAKQGAAKLKAMLADKSTVVFSQGCAKEETTVADLATRLLAGQELVFLKAPDPSPSDPSPSALSPSDPLPFTPSPK